MSSAGHSALMALVDRYTIIKVTTTSPLDQGLPSSPSSPTGPETPGITDKRSPFQSDHGSEQHSGRVRGHLEAAEDTEDVYYDCVESGGEDEYHDCLDDTFLLEDEVDGNAPEPGCAPAPALAPPEAPQSTVADVTAPCVSAPKAQVNETREATWAKTLGQEFYLRLNLNRAPFEIVMEVCRVLRQLPGRDMSPEQHHAVQCLLKQLPRKNESSTSVAVDTAFSEAKHFHHPHLFVYFHQFAADVPHNMQYGHKMRGGMAAARLQLQACLHLPEVSRILAVVRDPSQLVDHGMPKVHTLRMTSAILERATRTKSKKDSEEKVIMSIARELFTTGFPRDFRLVPHLSVCQAARATVLHPASPRQVQESLQAKASLVFAANDLLKFHGEVSGLRRQAERAVQDLAGQEVPAEAGALAGMMREAEMQFLEQHAAWFAQVEREVAALCEALQEECCACVEVCKQLMPGPTSTPQEAPHEVFGHLATFAQALDQCFDLLEAQAAKAAKPQTLLTRTQPGFRLSAAVPSSPAATSKATATGPQTFTVLMMPEAQVLSRRGTRE